MPVTRSMPRMLAPSQSIPTAAILRSVCREFIKRHCGAYCTTRKKNLALVMQIVNITEMAKDRVLQIRLTEDEKRGFETAAEIAGIPLSSWVRERLRLACIRDLESAGQKAPFLTSISLD